jgi:hypothetical protein
VDLGFGCAFLDVENPGDLLMLESFDIVEEKGYAAALRQLRDGSLQIDSCDGPVDWLGPSGMRHVERLGTFVHAMPTAAQVIETMVHGQTVKPRTERRSPFEGRQFAVHEEKNLLQKVFRISRIPAHPVREIVEPDRMTAVQLLKGLGVSAQACLDQIGVSRTHI